MFSIEVDAGCSVQDHSGCYVGDGLAGAAFPPTDEEKVRLLLDIRETF